MKTNKIIKFIVTEFVYNGHLQSIGAVAIANFYSLYVHSINITFSFALAVYLLFESVFLFDRYTGISKDFETNKERSEHLSKYKSNLPLIITSLAILSLLLFFLKLGFLGFLVALSILFFGFLYPIFFKGLTKNILIFKNIYVAGVYSYLFLLTSYTLAPVLMIYVFIQNLLAQILLDLKDIKSDSKEKLKTFGVVYGKQNALMLTITIALLSTLFFNSVFLVIIVVDLVINFIAIYLIYKNNKNGYLLAASKSLYWLLLFVYK